MIIFELEGDIAMLELDDTALGNHWTFSITTGISDCLVRTFQRRTDKNMPTFLTDVSQKFIYIDPPPAFSKATSKQGIALMSFVASSYNVHPPLGSKNWSMIIEELPGSVLFEETLLKVSPRPLAL